MFRSSSSFDFQVSDEDILVEQLTGVLRSTSQDLLPDLADTIRRVGGDRGTLYLTRDLQGVRYWTTDIPIEWPEGLIVAKWVLLGDFGTEVDRI